MWPDFVAQNSCHHSIKMDLNCNLKAVWTLFALKGLEKDDRDGLGVWVVDILKVVYYGKNKCTKSMYRETRCAHRENSYPNRIQESLEMVVIVAITEWAV